MRLLPQNAAVESRELRPKTCRIKLAFGALPGSVAEPLAKAEALKLAKVVVDDFAVVTFAKFQAMDKAEQDEAIGLLRWLPLDLALIRAACERMAKLPPSVSLRAADALHLACAADAGLKEIYSHDRHLLAAAPHFGLKGIDIISPKFK
jgi:predicted nucleic acid-binding protein